MLTLWLEATTRSSMPDFPTPMSTRAWYLTPKIFSLTNIRVLPVRGRLMDFGLDGKSSFYRAVSYLVFSLFVTWALRGITSHGTAVRTKLLSSVRQLKRLWPRDHTSNSTYFCHNMSWYALQLWEGRTYLSAGLGLKTSESSSKQAWGCTT